MSTCDTDGRAVDDLPPAMLWTPCDPGEVCPPTSPAAPLFAARAIGGSLAFVHPAQCHIYFSQQRKALSTGLALALALNRTLVLPPFEWYSGQAQLMANAFRATNEGRIPQFTPWSHLFDIEPLRQHVPVVELHELFASAGPAGLDFDRALYATGTSISPNDRMQATQAEGALQGFLAERPCKDRSSQGLLKNLTRAVVAGAWQGRVLNGAMQVSSMRCGMLLLDQPGATDALATWFGDAAMVAAFSVGHYPHAKLTGPSVFLPPASAIQQEADRYVAELQRPRPARGEAASGNELEFVAVHWRHGDYVPYRLLTPAQTVAKDAERALAAIRCPTCPVFLMTNCRDSSALDELRRLLPTLARYEPPDDRPEFAEEGPRLIIEQAIATQAAQFVGSPRSAVTLFVEEARHHAARMK